ncbi:hypothetical protein WG66_016073 [Moniliophthora roreri]|nr:hypothetical protein WG66_016073 [Moniliophthora roreri]
MTAGRLFFKGALNMLTQVVNSLSTEILEAEAHTMVHLLTLSNTSVEVQSLLACLGHAMDYSALRRLKKNRWKATGFRRLGKQFDKQAKAVDHVCIAVLPNPHPFRSVETPQDPLYGQTPCEFGTLEDERPHKGENRDGSRLTLVKDHSASIALRRTSLALMQSPQATCFVDSIIMSFIIPVERMYGNYYGLLAGPPPLLFKSTFPSGDVQFRLYCQ